MDEYSNRTVDLVINGGRIVDRGHITIPAWIAVNDGKIVSQGINDPPVAKKTIDATGKHVIPGCVDPENHPIPPVPGELLNQAATGV